MSFDSILFFSAFPDLVFSIHLEFFKNYVTTLPFRAINKDSLQGKEVKFINNLIIQKNYPAYLSELFEVIYIDVWATWCAPCREEIPHAIRLQKKFSDNPEVIFLNISIDQNLEKWQNFLSSKPEWQGIHINTLNQVSGLHNYLVTSIPQYILIDQEGKNCECSSSPAFQRRENC